MANRFYCTPIKKCLPAAESAKQKMIPQGKNEPELYGHRMSDWQQVRPLAQLPVYFEPKTKIAYSQVEGQ